jgi:hypothetical protein
LLSVGLTAIWRPALAQRDVAAEAEALFREGKRLMSLQDFAHACPKLAESYRLDPATGALLALAVCHEGEGRTASAWAEYGEVAARSKAEGRNDREQAARAKITALGGKLSTLTISVSTDAADQEHFHVTRDGVELGRAVWGVPIPVDPGQHIVHATASRGRSLRVAVAIGPDHDAKVVEIPKLIQTGQDEDFGAGAVSPPNVTSPVAPLAVTPRANNEAGPGEAPTLSSTPLPAAGAAPPAHSALRTIGIATMIGGGVALAIGGYFVSRAVSEKNTYQSDPTCTYDCAALDAANSAGNKATGFVIAGVALAGAGAAMYLLAPTRGSHVSLGFSPTVVANTYQLTATGRF